MRANLAANLVGKGYIAAFNILAVPVIARLLGFEAYGLVGLYASFQTIMMLLDFGLSATLGRAVAALAAKSTRATAQEMKDVVATFTFIFAVAGAAGGIVLSALAPLITLHWLKIGTLDPLVVRKSLWMMAGMLAVQWPSSMLVGTLVALERQLAANILQVLGTTIRIGGGIAVLVAVSRSPLPFLGWQLVASVLYTASCWAVVARSLPPASRRGRIGLAVLESRWHFVLGTGTISVLSVALVQADKVVLSRVLPLDEYGRYVIASTAASALSMLVAPVTQAIYPRMVAFVELRDTVNLRAHFHLMAQLLSFALLPATIALSMSPRTTIYAWTGDRQLTNDVAPTFVMLLVATTANGLMAAPYYLQLASNSTRLTVVLNLCATIVLVPALLIGARLAHGVGAATAMATVGVAYMLIGAPLLLRKFLRGQYFAYMLDDIMKPAIAACAAIAIVWAFPKPISRLSAVSAVIGTVLVGAVAAGLAIAPVRQWLAIRVRAVVTS